MKKSKRFTAVFIPLILTCWLYYESLPNFHIRHSFVKISDSGVETTLDVIVYKMSNSTELYQEIANEHNRINRTPNKLEINLYFLGCHYWTITFDYGEHLESTTDKHKAIYQQKMIRYTPKLRIANHLLSDNPSI